jgi:hypothetical protein
MERVAVEALEMRTMAEREEMRARWGNIQVMAARVVLPVAEPGGMVLIYIRTGMEVPESNLAAEAAEPRTQPVRIRRILPVAEVAMERRC